VPEEERDLYAAEYKNPIYTYPNSVHCHCDAMQAVRDTITEKRVFFLDDDITDFRKPYRETMVKVSGEDALFNIFNLTVMAMDLGVPLYGFADIGSVKFYRANKPFLLSGFLSASCMGFNDTDIRSTFKLKEDVDFCLQVLLEHRILWISYMMCAVHDCDRLAGGNMGVKNKEIYDRCMKQLKDKWGKYVQFKDNDHGNYKVHVIVPRTQK
jgi:hypothetical protein